MCSQCSSTFATVSILFFANISFLFLKMFLALAIIEQRVAVCCSVLQCVAIHSTPITLQHTATHSDTLQQHCNTLCCSVTGNVVQVASKPEYTLQLCILQHNATHCNTLQHTATQCVTLQHTSTHCNTLQHTATHCNTMQHTATQCNTVQHSATQCITVQHSATHTHD